MRLALLNSQYLLFLDENLQSCLEIILYHFMEILVTEKNITEIYMCAFDEMKQNSNKKNSEFGVGKI